MTTTKQFRVEINTGLPQIGHLYVNAKTPGAAEAIVKRMISDRELTSSDDRILFDAISKPTVLFARRAKQAEQGEAVSEADQEYLCQGGDRDDYCEDCGDDLETAEEFEEGSRI
jgi:hypothetical protein